MRGLRFRVQGSGFGVSGLGFRVDIYVYIHIYIYIYIYENVYTNICKQVCRHVYKDIQGICTTSFSSRMHLAFRVEGLRCRVQGSGFGV